MDVGNYRSSLAKSISKEEAKVIFALKHKEAERQRRIRINGQYANLCTILPNLIKRNKATVLAKTIQHLKELHKTVSKLKEIYGICRLSSVIPDGTEVLRVEYSNEQEQIRLVKVMFSCEDKRNLMSDVAKAVRSLKGKTVKAEMGVICGWIECALLVEGINGNQQLEMLKTSLDAIIERRIPNNRPLTR